MCDMCDMWLFTFEAPQKPAVPVVVAPRVVVRATTSGGATKTTKSASPFEAKANDG